MSQATRLRQLSFFDRPATPSGEPGPPCLKCGGATVVSPGSGPHHARADCLSCGAWRWLPKPRGEVES